jgi:hypothetical protein
MRNIVISIDVFAALWAKREAGEDSENAILERLLGLPKGPPLQVRMVAVAGAAQNGSGDGGIYNRMFDVHFPPGFEIFRNYKGNDYSAVVRDGRWIMGAQSYPSLFALSMAIVDSRENPWMHWKYRDPNGRVATISALRNSPAELEENLPPTPKKPAIRVSKKRSRN